MSDFSGDLRAFKDLVLRRQRGVFVGTMNELHRSVTEGSEITAAPGQPVDTGALKASWQETFPEEWVGQTATGLIYAPIIEDGVGPYGDIQLRSEVGGFHSVKLTRAGLQAVADHVTREVVGG